MALNINGTTGISGVDGSASAASIAGTDANTGLSFASDTVNINTGGVTRASLSSVGKFSIEHATSGNVAAEIHTSGSGLGNQLHLHNDHGLAYVGQAGDTTGDFIIYNGSSSNMLFSTNASERMRVDGNGRVMINTTSTSAMLRIRNTNLTTHTLIELFDDGGTGTHSQITFGNTNGIVGQITTNGSSTTYATSSDYRLKENATAISDGITRLKTLKPYRFNFKADASTTLDGFFAHEVTAVPEAIIGTKDEVDSDNNPVYQGIDQSKLVPLLTAALQEAVAKIEVLETENTQMKTDLTALTARVAALEAG